MVHVGSGRSRSRGVVRVRETSKTAISLYHNLDKNTFASHLGTFTYTRMRFGPLNAPAALQRALYIILSGFRWQSCLIYLDDVIVFSWTTDEYLRHFDEMVMLLRRAGITLQLGNALSANRRSTISDTSLPPEGSWSLRKIRNSLHTTRKSMTKHSMTYLTMTSLLLPIRMTDGKYRVLDLAQYSKLVGHPEQTRMYQHVRSSY